MSDTPKTLLRKSLLPALKSAPALSPQCLSEFTHRLVDSALFGDASAVVAYIAIQWEIPLGGVLSAVLRAGKPLFLPRYGADGTYALAEIHDLERDLQVGHFRIPEPALHCPDATALPPGALWLIPGVAFDTECHRLCRGGGFYDRLLERYPGGVTVGVCRDNQILDSVPTDEWDAVLQAILTPTRWISSRYDISPL